MVANGEHRPTVLYMGLLFQTVGAQPAVEAKNLVSHGSCSRRTTAVLMHRSYFPEFSRNGGLCIGTTTCAFRVRGFNHSRFSSPLKEGCLLFFGPAGATKLTHKISFTELVDKFRDNVCQADINVAAIVPNSRNMQHAT